MPATLSVERAPASRRWLKHAAPRVRRLSDTGGLVTNFEVLQEVQVRPISVCAGCLKSTALAGPCSRAPPAQAPPLTERAWPWQGRISSRPKPPRAKPRKRGAPPEPKPERTPQTVVEDKAHAYLQEHAGYLSDESVATLLAGLEPFELTVREKLQLINLGPVNEIDIHLVRTDRTHTQSVPDRPSF